MGANVNLLPYLVYKQLGLGELKPTTITLSLADRSIKIPKGIVEDVFVKVDKIYYPIDFVVLDTDPVATGANYVPIILGRPFLATSNAIINCRNGVMQLTFGNMTLELNIFHLSSKHEPPKEQEPKEFYLISTSEGEHYAQKLQGELKEILEEFDEELSTPPSSFTSSSNTIRQHLKNWFGWTQSPMRLQSPSLFFLIFYFISFYFFYYLFFLFFCFIQNFPSIYSSIYFAAIFMNFPVFVFTGLC